MNIENYYNPKKLNKYNFHVFITRTELRRFIELSSRLFTGKVLDLGCGFQPYKELIIKQPNVTQYIGIDLPDSPIYNGVSKDKTWDGKSIPFEKESIQTIIATELLEHCFDTDQILNEIFRVLSDDGQLIGSVPFIWPLHETPHDFYRFTPFSLQKKLEMAGFRDIQIVSFGGHDKALAVSLACWLGNHPGSRFKKKILRLLILPLIRKLIKLDKPGSDVTKENNTFIGLGFIAKK